MNKAKVMEIMRGYQSEPTSYFIDEDKVFFGEFAFDNNLQLVGVKLLLHQ